MKQDESEFFDSFQNAESFCAKKVSLGHTLNYLIDTKEKVKALDRETAALKLDQVKNIREEDSSGYISQIIG